MKEARQKRIQWRGEDDDTIKKIKHPKDESAFIIALQPQRIRTF
jgi:hypothetical protein